LLFSWIELRVAEMLYMILVIPFIFFIFRAILASQKYSGMSLYYSRSCWLSGFLNDGKQSTK